VVVANYQQYRKYLLWWFLLILVWLAHISAIFAMMYGYLPYVGWLINPGVYLWFILFSIDAYFYYQACYHLAKAKGYPISLAYLNLALVIMLPDRNK